MRCEEWTVEDALWRKDCGEHAVEDALGEGALWRMSCEGYTVENML